MFGSNTFDQIGQRLGGQRPADTTRMRRHIGQMRRIGQQIVECHGDTLGRELVLRDHLGAASM